MTAARVPSRDTEARAREALSGCFSFSTATVTLRHRPRFSFLSVPPILQRTSSLYTITMSEADQHPKEEAAGPAEPPVKPIEMLYCEGAPFYLSSSGVRWVTTT